MATPISEIMKHFTAEDWAYVESGQPAIRKAVEQERRKRERTRQADNPEDGNDNGPAVQRTDEALYP